MKQPDLDPTGGVLEVREVLIYYDGPQVFVARNPAGAIFVAIHGPAVDGIDSWLYVRTSGYRLSQLQSSSITLRELATIYSKGRPAIVTYPTPHLPVFSYIDVDQVPDNFLPHFDSYLDDPTDRKLEAAQQNPHQRDLTATDFQFDDLPVPTEVALWEFDPRTIDYLKSRMTPLNIVAHRRGRLVADIVFSAGDSRTDFPVPELGKILINLQKTLDSLAVEAGLATPTGRPSASLKRQTRLDAVATFPSSFGLRLEAHEGSLVDGSRSEVAFRKFIDLLATVTDKRALQEAFSGQTIETKLHFGEVIKEVAKAGSSIRVSAGSMYQDHIEVVAVPADAIARLAEEILDINEQEHVDIIIEGRLRAVSLKTKFFLIESDDESWSGRIDDKLLPKISGSEINAWYRASIVQRKILHEVTGEIETKSLLVSLDKIAPAND